MSMQKTILFANRSYPFKNSVIFAATIFLRSSTIILRYFNTATHIGMTATPKETDKVSNIEYFGDPIYTYSLKQGIDDGFLAPYKVVKVTLDIDAEGWRPPKGYVDKDGNPVEDRIYNRTDFDIMLNRHCTQCQFFCVL